MTAPVSLESARLDLSGLEILPGLINSHDHLQFALFPHLGAGPYPNATAWARDIYHPERDPVRTQLRVPKRLRLLWGGLRNLLAGVTTVGHHDPYDAVFDEMFPVEVVRHVGWAHSLEFSSDVLERFKSTPPGAPFVIHLAEGTDADAAQEVFRLHELGALVSRTVLVHAVGLNPAGWELVAQTGASVIWCPRSNLFTLGRTLDIGTIPKSVRIALGSDSPLTAAGDFLDELAFVRTSLSVQDSFLGQLCGANASRVLRLPLRTDDWIATPAFGEPPVVVVRGGRILLIESERASELPGSTRGEFYPLQVEGRPRVLVRWNIPQLIRDTAEFLDGSEIRLGGRVIDAAS